LANLQLAQCYIVQKWVSLSKPYAGEKLRSDLVSLCSPLMADGETAFWIDIGLPAYHFTSLSI
jgi:hypothetical protein